MDKEKEIKEEIASLKKTFASIPADRLKIAEGLIENAAFMRITLLELRKEVIEKGAVIEYQSGNGFDTIRDNPAQKAYTTMVSRYVQVMDQLNKMLPSKGATNNDELLEFLRGE